MKITTFCDARIREKDACCGNRCQLASNIILHPLICFIAILVQQVLVAATTIVIARAASAVANGVSPVQPILLFCVLLLTATLPDPLIEVEKERSKYALFNKAISRATSANYGATGAYFNKAVRTDKEPYIDTELWITVSDNVAFATDAFATLLNIVLNTVAIASVLNASFGYAFMASGGNFPHRFRVVFWRPGKTGGEVPRDARSTVWSGSKGH